LNRTLRRPRLTRRVVVSLALIGSAALVVVSGVQPAGALCPEPTAVDHDYTVLFAKQLRVAAPGLLVGSTPATGLHVETSWQHDPFFPSEDVSDWGNATITYGTPGGTQNRNGGFTYTPDPTNPFAGDDSFDYTLINACGDEADATANVTVVPIVVDASYAAMKDTPLVVSAADGFLAHDAGVDPFFSSYDATSAQGGTIDDGGNNDGSFVYTPPAGFVGTDTFGYTTEDLDDDNTYDATVHINVLTAFTAPSAPTAVVAALGGTGRATVGWNPPAANGSAITGYTVVASPGGKTVSGAAGPITISGLSSGVTYRFRVRATNAIGTGPLSAPSNAVTLPKPTPPPRSGYWMLAQNAKVFGFGNATAFASAGGSATAIAPRRDGTGYWVVDAAGTVTPNGSAAAHGGHPALAPGEIVSTISATPSGNGYWLFTNRGRTFAYGDARSFGDMSGTPLNGPIVASVATPTGHGYYMVGSDGGVFSFGDARFYGSTGNLHLNRPIVGISPTPDNRGYWLVASDGGVFAFDAPFRGSMGGSHLTKPVNGLVAYGSGYLMVASDGGVFDFSNKAFLGSLASHPPAAPIIGIAAFTTT
jgi:Fibronectin type III domain/Bacterial Ig domain